MSEAPNAMMKLPAEQVRQLALTAIRIEGLTIVWHKGTPRQETPLEDWSEHLRFTRDGPGSRLPIIGRSGSGKSSLLYVLAALKRPAVGRLSYEFQSADGASWQLTIEADLKDPEWARRARFLRRHCLGYLDQDTRLLPYLRMRENLEAVPRLLTGWRDEHQNRVDGMLPRLFPEVSESKPQDFPATLSGGQRRRAAMFPLMVDPPRVLFADEPTGSLDPALSRSLLDEVGAWQGETGSVFIWVTHDDPAGLGQRAGQVLDFGNGGGPRLMSAMAAANHGGV
ncbi:ATP-binding cassette domain-containing protein [Candidatus Thiodictyon syntrophicum]|jgi:ABC-type lipoprotein export system ATPase subunit|nr:ATP-binding cassette domain-containing protein [Candidatus Thiodictyon syntrophicum]